MIKSKDLFFEIRAKEAQIKEYSNYEIETFNLKQCKKSQKKKSTS